MNFAGKKIWITGASGVIGAAVAQKMFENGATVYQNRVDITNLDDINKTVLQFQPDVLINCTGILGPVGIVTDNSIDHWLKTINVNLIGAFYLTKAVLPGMVNKNYGKIIHFSGGGAAYGRPLYSAYAVSKTGLVRFVENVAEEFKDFNIQINAIAPGSVKSKMNPESKGLPNLAVKLVEFLVSDASRYLNGRLISAVHDDWEKGIQLEGGLLRRVPLNKVNQKINL
jgi:NAD(P)-dependent dehydrogenase (short-subunit alcohol dehydrogenase family)